MRALHELSKQSDTSYAGEWAHLHALLARLNLLEQRGFALDIGAGDGVTSSCTLPLYRDHLWSGLAIEADAARFALLEGVLRAFPAVVRKHVSISPHNLAATLAGVTEPITVANVDIDSFDLEIARQLAAEFQPLIIDLEINEKLPPPIRFATLYSANYEWDESHRYGCSLAAAVDVLIPLGYVLEGLEYNNAFFVRADIAALVDLKGLDTVDAYERGYRQRTDRLTLFPWNRDMERLHSLPANEGIDFVRRKFGAGDYVLQLEPL